MKLYLIGHDYKYAAEQIMLMMFPNERPEYPPELVNGDSDSATIKLSSGKEYITAHSRVFNNGAVSDGYSRVKARKIQGKLAKDRLLQKIIKLSFYKAALNITGEKPAWGALTGIRPGKIITNMLEKGIAPEMAEKVMQNEYFVSPERSSLCVDTAKSGLSVKRTLGKRDAVIYVGIPFCPTRCAYCSFVSQSVEKSIKLIEPFLETLFAEINKTAEIVRDLKLRVTAVYIGGGTPTTLSALQLDNLIKKLMQAFNFTYVEEFTVEAGRPDTITREKLKVLKDNHVTRISINPQSMSDNVLEAIGRKHTAEDILKAYELARSEGPKIINMDLIAGLPYDTADGFYKTLDTVIGLDPENITVHTLALKKGARITLEGTKLPPETEVAQMLDYAVKRLRQSGYVPYYLYRQKFISGGFENVGWCKSGFESRYNICIMEELCSVIAMGGGASTKLVNQNSGKIERIFNAKYPYEYIEGIDKILSDKEYIKKFYNDEVL